MALDNFIKSVSFRPDGTKVLTLRSKSNVQPNLNLQLLVERLQDSPTKSRLNPMSPQVTSVVEAKPFGSIKPTIYVYTNLPFVNQSQFSAFLSGRNIPGDSRYVNQGGIYCVDVGVVHIEFYQSN